MGGISCPFLKKIESYIRSGESASQNLGLEIEHFIIDKINRDINLDADMTDISIRISLIEMMNA